MHVVVGCCVLVDGVVRCYVVLYFLVVFVVVCRLMFVMC